MNSINKGKDFERQTADFLTKNTGVAWHRVPQSGATATTKQLERFHGDVFTEHARFKDVVVECKACSKLSVSDLFNPKSLFYQYVEQAQDESTRPDGSQSDWLLFVKPDNNGTYVISSKYSTLGRLGIPHDNSILIRNKLLVVKVR